MSDLFVKPYAGGSRRLIYVTDMLEDTSLVAGLGGLSQASGGVEFLTADGLILVDDILGTVVDNLLAAGVEALREGKDVRYRARLTGDIHEIRIDGHLALINPEEADNLEVPLDALIEAMDAAVAEYRTLLEKSGE